MTWSETIFLKAVDQEAFELAMPAEWLSSPYTHERSLDVVGHDGVLTGYCANLSLREGQELPASVAALVIPKPAVVKRDFA